MTGRFGHLEFEDKKPAQQAQRTGVPIPSADQYLRMADEEYRWGRFERALQLYTKCLEEDRRMVPAWVGQVQMLVQLGEQHEARLWSDKALEIFRNNGELLAAKSQACLRMRDAASAIACSDASLQAVGSSPWRWEVRGEVLLARGEHIHDTCFQKALAEPAADWFDRVIIAGIYLFYRRAAAAFEYAKKAVEMAGDAGYAWFVLGHAQRELGQTALACRSYRHCLQLRPDYAEARQALQDLETEPFFRRLLRQLGWRRR